MLGINLVLNIDYHVTDGLYQESAMSDDWFCWLIHYGGHACWWDMDMSMATIWKYMTYYFMPCEPNLLQP